VGVTLRVSVRNGETVGSAVMTTAEGEVQTRIVAVPLTRVGRHPYSSSPQVWGRLRKSWVAAFTEGVELLDHRRQSDTESSENNPKISLLFVET